MAGIDRADFAAQTGIDLDQVTAHREHLVSIGLIDDSAQRLRLTREGLFVADSVLAKLLDMIDGLVRLPDHEFPRGKIPRTLAARVDSANV